MFMSSFRRFYCTVLTFKGKICPKMTLKIRIHCTFHVTYQGVFNIMFNMMKLSVTTSLKLISPLNFSDPDYVHIKFHGITVQLLRNLKVKSAQMI